MSDPARCQMCGEVLVLFQRGFETILYCPNNAQHVVQDYINQKLSKCPIHGMELNADGTCNECLDEYP